MRALYIIAGILLFFALLLFIKIKVRVSFCGDIEVVLKALFFKFSLYPGKEKKPKKAPPREEKPKEIPQKKPKPPRAKLALRDALTLIKELITEFISKFGKYLKLEEYRVRLLVATPDPADTALLYGAASAALGSISVLVYSLKRKSRKKGAFSTEIKPDFLAEQPELFFSAALSIRVWQLFSVGITATRAWLKYLSLTKPAKISAEQKQ